MLLLGQPLPSDLPAGPDFSAEAALLSDVPPGLPSELLTKRPDIRSAEQSLLAANAAVLAERLGVINRENSPAAWARFGAGDATVFVQSFLTFAVSHPDMAERMADAVNRDAVARDIDVAYGYFPILKERAAQDAGLLSGGQQQMLSISRALMAAPALILLDEPSLGLSPRLTREIFEIVIRINRERGTTLLLVEQNANMALNASDYGYVLENGRIVMEDSCERLREKDDIKEFYLGMKADGARGERRWKRKKTWR